MLSVGDKVVCVNASMLAHTVEELTRDVPNWVKEGQQYIIRGFADHDFVVGVYLEEIHNPPKWFNLVGGFIEPAFKESRFRKLEETTKEISVEQEELITL
jgi:hypothetical protein